MPEAILNIMTGSYKNPMAIGTEIRTDRLGDSGCHNNEQKEGFVGIFKLIDYTVLELLLLF